jgi:hypothetical protein
VLAWGGQGGLRDAGKSGRTAEVLDLLNGTPVYCLGRLKNGAPRHPLYMKKDIELKEWLK